MSRLITLGTMMASALAHISLSCITSGLSSATFWGIITSISGNLASDSLKNLSPNKLKDLIFGVHPNNLNHSIKKLFIQSMSGALDNIVILYSETGISKQEKKEIKKITQLLKKSLSETNLMQETQINDNSISDFLNKNYNENSVPNSIFEKLNDFPINDSFKEFIGKHYSTQIQLCFGEGLKDPKNHNAWVAFQRMMFDEIRDAVNEIVKTQNQIKDDIATIKVGTLGLDQKQIKQLQKLNELLADERKFNIALDNAVTQSLSSIESTANELIRITTDTHKTVKELRSFQIQQERREQILLGLIISVLGAVIIGVAIMVYKVYTSPFNFTVVVHGWKGKDHFPLKGEGRLVIQVADKILKSEINKQGYAIFTDVPHSFVGIQARIFIDQTEGMPYFCADTTLLVQKELIYLPIRLEGLSLIQGVIKDSQSLVPINEAKIFVAGESTTTDTYGAFTLPIPLDKQEELQEIEIFKDGYVPYRATHSTMGKNDFRIFMDKN